MARTKILLLQLGSPASLKISDVRSYLREFLSDPRVIDLPRFFWSLILYLFVLPFRPKRTQALYKNIVMADGKLPLVYYTDSLAKKLKTLLPEYEIEHAFLLGKRRPLDILRQWELENNWQNTPELIIVPLFPQYSESTIASCFDVMAKTLQQFTYIPTLRFLHTFHDSHVFVNQGLKKIEAATTDFRSGDALLFSFHGLPVRRILTKKDPYYRQCLETFHLLRERLSSDKKTDCYFAFQSRFGSEEWLGPSISERINELAQKGYRRIFTYCPSFITDCLETTDEIGREIVHEAEAMGTELKLISCLNDDQDFALGFSQWIKSEIEFPKENRQNYRQEAHAMTIEDPKYKNAPMSPQAKGVLKIVFLTLFLDLVGFSIIFPLFPALAKYYLEVDSQNYWLRLIFDSVTSLVATENGQLTSSHIVLFGGALGALYSLLQFVAAPIWGTISDRIGRRPVLLISVFGLAVSYLLWGIAGNFTLLVVARFIGGVMGGNISTATAVVADVTEKHNRSKGMAIVGVAFATGFILGPAMGGILSLIDLTKWYPHLSAVGLNPFSAAALLAFILSAINFIFLAVKFKETLPPNKRGQGVSHRSVNPVKLFMPLPYPGINLTNFGNFLFLTAFSGMEFTLTFLAVERLGNTSMQNAYMFIFIGVILALVQGGYVRRKAHMVGEKRMVLQGMVTVIPGLLLIGYTQSQWMLYLGLFFLAVGSSMVIPCLTSLVSMYLPSEKQGQGIGVFRSLGALARVIGPLVASLVYWHLGSSSPYLIGAGFLLIPILLVSYLPAIKKA